MTNTEELLEKIQMYSIGEVNEYSSLTSDLPLHQSEEPSSFHNFHLAFPILLSEVGNEVDTFAMSMSATIANSISRLIDRAMFCIVSHHSTKVLQSLGEVHGKTSFVVEPYSWIIDGDFLQDGSGTVDEPVPFVSTSPGVIETATASIPAYFEPQVLVSIPYVFTEFTDVRDKAMKDSAHLNARAMDYGISSPVRLQDIVERIASAANPVQVFVSHSSLELVVDQIAKALDKPALLTISGSYKIEAHTVGASELIPENEIFFMNKSHFEVKQSNLAFKIKSINSDLKLLEVDFGIYLQRTHNFENEMFHFVFGNRNNE